MQFIPMLLLICTVLYFWHYRDYYFNKKVLCPECGEELEVDKYKYRHTLLWTCSCGFRRETLRNK